jgi:hypothetical protein
MPNATITSTSVCSGGEHRTFVTDQGAVMFLTSELAASPSGFDELKEAFRIVVRHQYWSRRAANRTHAQALADLVGFVVRL